MLQHQSIRRIGAARAMEIAMAAIAACLAIACASTSSEIVGPTAPRCQMDLAVPRSAPSSAGTVTATLATTRDCTWTLQVDGAWVSAKPASGQGEATIVLTVNENAQARSRSATILVNDQRFTMTQEGAPCRFEITPLAATAASQGARIQFSVRTLDGCAWSTEASQPWIRVVSGSGGDRTGSIEVTVDSNQGDERRGTLRVASTSVVITQQEDGTGVNHCPYSLGSGAAEFAAAGGEGSVMIHTRPTCFWGASSDQPWLTIVSSRNGRGTEAVRYQVARNTTSRSRSGVITIDGRRHVVKQAAGPA
jgi:hypothetical protein